ncbi:lysM domain-containing GPI-anchored protein 3-like isoform X4 [Camellia sinensis]|uniref:lysM domain-containing GPI-anchored protein 3-like isoform X4 n=1 Tax=Camellia sinensis TaxID=4442 RepID=UPI001036BBF9|nr:lysM domain-containing GPI-anchored protein 3-like isoform X4 [Camellia sinensis]
MKKVLHHHLLSLLLFIFSFTTDSKSVIEPCYSSDSCPSLLSYRLPWDSKLSEVAFIFQLNISDILGSNNIDAMVPWSSNQILPARSLVKVPTSCQCVNGIRRSVSTIYTVRASDTWNSIAKGYGELVSAEQIRISNVEVPLTSGQRLVIPLPCMCLNNTDGEGGAAVYMSYVVEIGENLSSIGDEFGTTVHELEGVNGFDQSQVSPGDVLAIPIPACSSANLRWYNESLVLPNGSYTLTANNCVKCSCDQHSDLSAKVPIFSLATLMRGQQHLVAVSMNVFTVAISSIKFTRA